MFLRAQDQQPFRYLISKVEVHYLKNSVVAYPLKPVKPNQQGKSDDISLVIKASKVVNVTIQITWKAGVQIGFNPSLRHKVSLEEPVLQEATQHFYRDQALRHAVAIGKAKKREDGFKTWGVPESLAGFTLD